MGNRRRRLRLQRRRIRSELCELRRRGERHTRRRENRRLSADADTVVDGYLAPPAIRSYKVVKERVEVVLTYLTILPSRLMILRVREEGRRVCHDAGATSQPL